MKSIDELRALRAELSRTRSVLGKIEGFYGVQFPGGSGAGSRDVVRAIVLADVVTNYYTCLETLFFRVSQFFENSLDAERWHQDLLRRVQMDIPGERQAVISQEAAGAADELLRFRHFRRYYFEFEYDWDRLALVEKKFLVLKKAVGPDLAAFDSFLACLERELASGA